MSLRLQQTVSRALKITVQPLTQPDSTRPSLPAWRGLDLRFPRHYGQAVLPRTGDELPQS